MVQSI